MTAETPKTAVVPVARVELSRLLDSLTFNPDRIGAISLAKQHISAWLAAAPEAIANRDPQGGEPVAWRDISDHDGSPEPVLLWFPDFAPQGSVIGHFRAAATDDYYPGQWVDDLNNEPFEVMKGEVFPTHWMPLPASPQDDRMGGLSDGGE